MFCRVAILLTCGIAFFLGFLEKSSAMDLKRSIVVWKLQANKGVDDADVNLISNFVANQVAKYSGSKVISEADIQTILKGEQTRQKCGMEDTSCITEIGAALGVTEAVSGDIGKIGDFWMLNLRRINVRSAEVIGRSSRNAEGSVNDLIRSLPEAVAELFGIQITETTKTIDTSVSGMLLVTSKPENAWVWVNGKKIGKTPLKEKLKADIYKIVVKRQGYGSLEKVVRILHGETTDIVFQLKRLQLKGILNVTTTPSGALIWIDGKEKGTTPFRENVTANTYLIKLKLEGYETVKERTIVTSEKETKIHLALEKDYPMNPYKKYGYVSFFTGIGLVTGGGIATWQASEAAADNKAGDWNTESKNRTWSSMAIASYTLGGAAILIGTVLWVISPGDQEWAERNHIGASVASDGRGAVVWLEGRW